MIKFCPHCRKELKLSDEMRKKVDQALEGLADNGILKLSCPYCRETIELKKDGSLASGKGGGGDEDERTSRPVPPAPPNISWLKDGAQQPEFDEVFSDLPLAMVMVKDPAIREQVAETLKGMDYQVEFAESSPLAIERMRFVSFSVVVLSSDYEGDLASSSFHQHMCKMPMLSRRQMLYAIIGPDFHTLYDLEALVNSANLVVNQRDISKLHFIMKKALHSHKQLFGPYIEALKAHGKL